MNLETDLKEPIDIIKKYKIKLLVLFGSFGTDYAREDSDLDLGYLSEELLNMEEEINLLNDLIRFYQRSNIDLVNLRKATPGLKLEIAKEGRVVFEREEEFLKYQLYASKVFADTKHIRELRREVLEDRINKL